MPQKNIDGEWEGSYDPNLSAWARRLDGLNMTTEEKRRYIIEHHEHSLAFLLDAAVGLGIEGITARFTKWLDVLPSLESIARCVRAKHAAKPKQTADAPVGFDPPYYPLYLQTHHWRVGVSQMALAVYKSCVLCNSTVRLTVHHRHYNTLAYESAEDLSVLCGNCHDKVTRSILPSLRVPKKPSPEVKRLLKREGKIP